MEQVNIKIGIEVCNFASLLNDVCEYNKYLMVIRDGRIISTFGRIFRTT